MTISFSEFTILTEELHPELQKIVRAPTSTKNLNKHASLAKKIRELQQSGEETGIEGNMPKGSSRAYLQHKDELPIIVDGKRKNIKTGIKVAIRNPLDKHLDKDKYSAASLGHLQNLYENGDHFVNREYRILSKDDDGNYKHNPSGIFPPLIDHDHDNHEWSHVGHSENITKKRFKELTKNEHYPEGISHDDFVDALVRRHDMNHGKHWTGNEKRESHLDHVENHPLVQNFIDHQETMGYPPHDYRQIKNLGSFKFGNNEHIVARDHGFSSEVDGAYRDTRIKYADSKFDKYNR